MHVRLGAVSLVLMLSLRLDWPHVEQWHHLATWRILHQNAHSHGITTSHFAREDSQS
jgi:hypothetical protein